MPEGVPQNVGFMAAAYIVTALILLSYALALHQRGRKP